MRTFRLLLWLRWRLSMNVTTRSGRWGTVALTALLALAFAPFYVGATVFSYVHGAREGAAALLLVFGGVQATIVWVSLLAGALGRTFELEKLRRYPFHPLHVQSFNVLASLTEPIVLMTAPSLVAVTLGVWSHDGPLAGIRAAVGALLLLLISAAALQLLLALLDDFLRREWMRYVAALLFTGSILSVQLFLGRSSSKLAEEAQRVGVTPETLLSEARRMFAGVPSVAAPASVAGAPVSGPMGEPLLALAVSAALLVVPLWWGARVMARAVTRESLAGRSRAAGARMATGSFAARWPGLSPPQQLLLAREWRYLLRTPAILYQIATIPLVVVVLTVIGRTREAAYGWLMPAIVMTSTLSARNLTLWAHDGPGIRMLFLLPFSPRDLVLSKNVSWLLSAFAEAGVTFALVAVLRPATFLPQLPLLATGYAAMAFAAAAVGTWVSIVHPVRLQERGFARRNPGGAKGAVAYLTVLAMGAGLVLSVMAARALAPDPLDLAASLAVTTVLLVVAFALWRIAMDRHADELVRHRERMIDVLAKSADG